MKEINKVLQISFLLFCTIVTQAESKVLSIGSPNAKVTVKVFSSLTCPHCASFHGAVFNDLKKDYIDKGLVRFEHRAFPLDLAALNAEIVIGCQINKDKKFKLLGEIYKKQKIWAVGSDINKINDLIIDPGFGFGKTLQHNYEILSNLHHFKMIDLPLLVGFSRKSMITKALEIEKEFALNGTTILNTIALMKGAKILRVHDVKETVDAMKVWNIFK